MAGLVNVNFLENGFVFPGLVEQAFSVTYRLVGADHCVCPGRAQWPLLLARSCWKACSTTKTTLVLDRAPG